MAAVVAADGEFVNAERAADIRGKASLELSGAVGAAGSVYSPAFS